VHGGFGCGFLGEVAVVSGGFEHLEEAIEFLLVEGEVDRREFTFFGSGEFLGRVPPGATNAPHAGRSRNRGKKTHTDAIR
jgi:hypothetical protein